MRARWRPRRCVDARRMPLVMGGRGTHWVGLRFAHAESPSMKHPVALALVIALSGSMAACTDTGAGKNESAATTAQSDAKAFDASNPFFAESTLPLHYPQFDKIKDRDRKSTRLNSSH